MASAWTSEDRPSQPCVVCHGVPDRVVRLPRLPDVHIAFASSAMCTTCADLAAANSVEELSRRGDAAWDDDRGAVANLVRLVVAAFGHEPPPAEVAPEQFRHRSIEPLSDADAELWGRLEPLIYDGPGGDPVRVRGTIEYWTSDYPERQVTLAVRNGVKARLADADGRTWLLCDGTTVWRRDADTESMWASPYSGRDQWAGEGVGLAGRRTRHDVELFDFGTPIGPIEATTFLGRSAWRFRFAAPPHKPFDMAVVVDDETGLILDQRFGDYSVARWISFDSDPDLTDESFRWDGPIVDAEEQRRERDAEHDRYEQTQRAWFAAHVTPEPLVVRGRPVRVMLHVNEPDGSFQATLTGGLEAALARRPLSDEWWNLGWSDVTHRWSDETWDWALMDFDDLTPDLTDDQFADLRRALGYR